MKSESKIYKLTKNSLKYCTSRGGYLINIKVAPFFIPMRDEKNIFNKNILSCNFYYWITPPKINSKMKNRLITQRTYHNMTVEKKQTSSAEEGFRRNARSSNEICINKLCHLRVPK